ncbi:MAG: hypothetical protein U9R15_20520 [Chloroflexota bacterium]|nr:hypothetical protein [Chloroflexota bacterium]
MIVLDEQLLGRDIELEIAKWYQGAVRFITDLRPDTIIKDDAVPVLLRCQNYPTFVTINEKDFWHRVTVDNQYCLVCFTLPDSRTHEIPQRLRSLLRQPEFKTKAKRMGKVIRVTDRDVIYYAFGDREVKTITL